MATEMTDTFTCEACGKSLPKGDDAAALAEMNDNFPGLNLTDAAIVCDDCFKKIMKEHKK